MTAQKKAPSFGHNEGTVTLILSSLAGGEKHGYALVKDVEEFADVLVRLEKQNLIEPVASDDRRRPYRLTATGALVLNDRLRAQRHVADVGLKRLGRGWSIA